MGKKYLSGNLFLNRSSLFVLFIFICLLNGCDFQSNKMDPEKFLRKNIASFSFAQTLIFYDKNFFEETDQNSMGNKTGDFSILS